MLSEFTYTISTLERRKAEAVQTYEHVTSNMNSGGVYNEEKDVALAEIKSKINELSKAIRLLTYC